MHPPQARGTELMGEWALVPDALWDGSRMRLDHGILIVGRDISRIVPVDDVPSSMQRVTVSGTALPGLIDSHVHLADWMLPGFLAAGVTTVRDMGNDLDWILERRARTAADPTSGPRILCVGPLLDGEQAWWPGIGRPHVDPAAMRRSVDELAHAGVDAIKLYVNVTPAQMTAAVEQATQHGLSVLAHLGTTGISDALAAGVAELEHMSGYVHHIQGGLTTTDPKQVDMGEVVLCPTLVVWDRLGSGNDMVFAADERREWVPPEIRQAWSRFPQRFGPPEERLSRQASVVAMKSRLLTLFEAGTTVIAGSDTPWPNIPPGFGLHDELAFLVDAGMSPVDALVSATTTPARVLGLSGEIGRLEPGYRADIVVTEGDPTLDILALQAIRLTVRDGVPIPVDELRGRRFDPAWERDPVSRLILGQGEGAVS